MVTVGKTQDRIGNENNSSLIFLGNTNNTTFLKEDGGQAFFDENNIDENIITKGRVTKTTSSSFINSKKFYTCNTNAQTYLCFRCVGECVNCAGCRSCDACNSCNGCNGQCNSCQDCDNTCASCNLCNGCNGCNSCNAYWNGAGK